VTTVYDIEVAVEQLAPEQRTQFRASFGAFDACGQLDWLAEEALNDLAAGRCTDR
jgi:Ser/Thr protein kinase RdoA (MazF antagonist)